MEKNNMITKISNGFAAVEKTITWILFAMMLGLMLMQVFCRYVLRSPLAWAEESITYSYIAVSFIGAIVAVHEKNHISIDIVLSIVNRACKTERTKAIVLDFLDIFAEIVQVIFFVVLTMWMANYNMDIAAKGQITTANLWPMWLMCLPVTVSCGLMAFHALLNSLESAVDIRAKRKAGAVK